MPPPSRLSLTLRIGCAVAHQTLDRNDFPEPLPGRLGKMTTPAPASRNVVLDGAHRRDLGPVANVEMIVDSHLRAQRDMIANREATSQSYLGSQQTVSPNRHIVTDLDLVVDFRALADHGVAQAAAVDGRSCPDLHLILDQNAASLRDLQMAFRAKENEPIAVLSDAAAGMDEDLIADQRELDGRSCADVAIPPDPDIGGNQCTRADDCPCPDRNIRTDHSQWIDNHAVFQVRRRVDNRGGRDAGAADPGLGTQGVAVELARNRDECAERMVQPQHGHTRWNACLEAFTDQTGARLRRSQLIGIFQIVEKRQMHRAGFIERSESLDLQAAP